MMAKNETLTNDVKTPQQNKLTALGDMLTKGSTVLILGIVLILLAGFFWWANKPSLDALFITGCITLIWVMGFQLFMGNSGILAWSYMGFCGIGAFVSAICSMTPEAKESAIPIMYPILKAISMPLPLALIVGALVAAALAALVAWPIMRLSGAVCAITHFALLIVINALLSMWGEVTNGPRNFTVGFLPEIGLWTVVICALAVIAFTYFFKESSLGLRLRASRDDRFAAQSSGVNVVAVRYFAFVISAAVGAFGGGLYAHYILDFTGHLFYMSELFVILSMLVIGGSMSVSGSFFGMLIVTAGRYGLRQFEASSLWKGLGIEMAGTTEIILSVLMIIFLIWKPNGISGGNEISITSFKKFFGKFKKTKTPTGASTGSSAAPELEGESHA